jgi:hypothetical protein
MKQILFIISLFLLVQKLSAQGEDAAGSLLLAPTAMASFSNLTPSNCGTTTYNLGTSTSLQTPAPTSGTMSNDVWFHFVAVAEVAKIKVCSPTTFDAAIEVWNSAATGAAIASANVAGSGGKEWLCASSLTIGATYKVRVGRVSGTGAGTFSIRYEHLGVEVASGFYPDPPGAATCYNFITNMQRTFITYPVGGTRWKFVDQFGTVLGPFNLSFFVNLSQIPGVCEGETYQVSCEVQANDPECGDILWGFSTPRPIVVCETICPTISANANTIQCGGVFTDIFNTSIGTGNIGNGFQYQFRFVTDNGLTDFCSAWQTSPFFQTSVLPYTNYFRYNKIYAVYVRVKKCNDDPAWCGPCTFSTTVLPYISINSSLCCKWRNKNSGTPVTAAGVNGMDQYRFRFSPIDPCSSNPFLPIGPAVTTNWSASLSISTSGLPLQLGTVYNVQVQCRVLPSTVINCDGTTNALAGQQSDWGPPCFIGIRASNSPPVGATVDCCIQASAMLEEEWNMLTDEYRMTEFDNYDMTTDDGDMASAATPELTILSANSRVIELNIEEAGLFGDGQAFIYSLSGQVLHSEKITAMHTSNYLRVVSQTELSAGIYLISVHSDYGTVTTKYFIQ